ncbi:unnamed protein product [Soboliphyme baturini]|uniref:RPOL4c domain-containing protein n=1 Tax=Soboliphyme baturini TaxID=241478 RepID=A0A183IZU0_9BILA|nr:unnamed protein product [Soboliphyme baturini]
MRIIETTSIFTLFHLVFENAETLFISEVYLLLECRRHQSESMDDNFYMSEFVMKTFDYTQEIGKFKNRDTIRALRQLLSAKNLHKFEIAQLANLCPETAEEAKALIPRYELYLFEITVQKIDI